MRKNPERLTVYFGGKRGEEIRANYRALTKEVPHTDADGKTHRAIEPLFPVGPSRSDAIVASDVLVFRKSRKVVNRTLSKHQAWDCCLPLSSTSLRYQFLKSLLTGVDVFAPVELSQSEFARVFRDMRARNLIQENAFVAGHSLGEYAGKCVEVLFVDHGLVC